MADLSRGRFFQSGDTVDANMERVCPHPGFKLGGGVRRDGVELSFPVEAV